MLLSVSAIPAQRWLEPSTFMLSKSICLNYRRSDESPVVPQQAGGLSPALHLNWSTRVVCRDGGRGKRREGDGGRIDGWSRETPTFSSVSSAEAHPTVSLRGTEAAGNLQETGDQFGSFLSGIKKKSGPKIRGANKQKLNKGVDYCSSPGCCGVNIPAEGGEIITDTE